MKRFLKLEKVAVGVTIRYVYLEAEVLHWILVRVHVERNMGSIMCAT